MSTVTRAPIIHEFNTSNLSVEKEQSFVLSWKVEGADKLQLYRNGVPYRDLAATETSIMRTEFMDGTKAVEYELYAYRNGVLSRSSKIIIRLGKAPLPGAGAATQPRSKVVSQAAFWTSFVAIAGIALSGLAILIFTLAIVSGSAMDPAAALYFVFLFIVTGLVPMILLLRFARKLNTAAVHGDEPGMTTAFQRLKLCFKYIAIVAVVLVFYTLMLILWDIFRL